MGSKFEDLKENEMQQNEQFVEVGEIYPNYVIRKMERFYNMLKEMKLIKTIME